MDKKQYVWILLFILLAGGFLRFFAMNRGDTLTDEVLYSFRAIGMLDFDEAAEQTTPLEWFDPHIPSWVHLSFHDHPPLVFFVQHVCMALLGETPSVFRLPSALFGIASIWLLYLIGSALYSKKVGLIAAALLAVTVNHIYISRLGLQESYVIFFILLACYMYLRSRKNDIYLVWLGIAIGLGFLAKYTVLVVLPALGALLLLEKREYLRDKKLWIGVTIALLLASPVIVYNIHLYRAVGHFDFQLSYIFHQNPPEWKVEPGKAIGSLADRARLFLPNLIKVESPLFLALASITLAAFFVMLAKHPKETLVKHQFLISLFIVHLLLFSFIGVSYRFISMLTPWLALGASYFFINVPLPKKVRIALLAAIAIFEIAYGVNTQILFYPQGREIWAYAPGIRNENYNFGFNALSDYLARELNGKMPALAFEQKYHFLADIHKMALDQDIKEKLRSYSAVIIYDGNIASIPQLWILDRLQIYHAWPVVKTETYIEYLAANKLQAFTKDGFEKHYFIRPADSIPEKGFDKLTSTGAAFEKELTSRGVTPLSIKNPRGEEAFRVYVF